VLEGKALLYIGFSGGVEFPEELTNLFQEEHMNVFGKVAVRVTMRNAMRKTIWGCVGSLVFVALGSGSAFSQTAEMQALEDRIDYLEDEMETMVEESGAAMYAKSMGISIRGFADVVYRNESYDGKNGAADRDVNEFSIGQLDLFPSAELSDDVSFLSELVFTSKSDGSTAASIERLIVKWEPSDYLNFQVGRFHTTVGYWNETYHHGEWLQTTIGRPELFRFDSSGGILPIHLVGGMARGTVPLQDIADIDYTIEVGNGRPAFPGTQTAGDIDTVKAYNFALAARPSGMRSLQIGGNIYSDKIPENTDEDKGALRSSMDETIYGGFITYLNTPIELIAEAIQVEHEDMDSEGYYLQAGYRIGDYMPYARWDSVEIDDADTFYRHQDDRETITAGIRWDMNTWTAIKLQATFGSVTFNDDENPGSEQDLVGFAAQTSIAF